VLDVEDWAEIRRLHLAEGLSIKEIKRRRGHSELWGMLQKRRRRLEPLTGADTRFRARPSRVARGIRSSGVLEPGMHRLVVEPCVGPGLQPADQIAVDEEDVLPDGAMAGLSPVHVHRDAHAGELIPLLTLDRPACWSIPPT
jgi:hypothetical protein